MAGPGIQQSQNLALQQVLSPQLQQSLLILQTPLLELRNLVQQEMETNPVLEELPDEPSSDAPGEAEPPDGDNFKDEFEKLAGGRGKQQISASSFSIPLPCRRRFSKICWDN